jgi:hypothetical protein
MGVRGRREVTAGQAIAYRLAAHHLHEMLPPDGLLDAAGVAAVQDTPPGSAGVALANRVAKLTPDDLEAALHDDRTLLRVLAMRGAAHLVARRDATVFGPGALGADEESLREQLAGAWPTIDGAGWSAREALGAVIGVLTAVLADAEPRTKGQLSEALHDRLPSELEPWCDVCDVHHVPDQLLRLAGTAGVYAYGWPHGSRQTLMAPDIWLGEPLGGDVAEARIELARRFLHAYGPASPRHLAAWTGVSVGDARDRFASVGHELVEVRLDGAPTMVLAADLDAIVDPPLASGARLLPAGDPFLAQRDRATLLPDKAHQRAVWRPSGSPGLALVAGRPVGLWRARKAGERLCVTVDPFTSLGERKRAAIDHAASFVAPFRGCDASEVDVAG